MDQGGREKTKVCANMAVRPDAVLLAEIREIIRKCNGVLSRIQSSRNAAPAPLPQGVVARKTSWKPNNFLATAKNLLANPKNGYEKNS